MKFHHATAGAASMFDLSTQLGHGHAYQRLGLPPHIIDALSLAKDWRRIGVDLETAMIACAEILAADRILRANHQQDAQLELFEDHFSSQADAIHEAVAERIYKALHQVLEEEELEHREMQNFCARILERANADYGKER